MQGSRERRQEKEEIRPNGEQSDLINKQTLKGSPKMSAGSVALPQMVPELMSEFCSVC